MPCIHRYFSEADKYFHAFFVSSTCLATKILLCIQLKGLSTGSSSSANVITSLEVFPSIVKYVL
jgi:hypothetical protein